MKNSANYLVVLDYYIYSLELFHVCQRIHGNEIS